MTVRAVALGALLLGVFGVGLMASPGTGGRPCWARHGTCPPTTATTPTPTTTSVPTTTTTPTTTQSDSAVCSRSSTASCPASYFTGPLGANDLLPATPGAFLILWDNSIGLTWPQAQAKYAQRMADAGRSFDGIGFQYDGSTKAGGGSYDATWGGVVGMNDPTVLSPAPEQWIHDRGSFPVISWTPNYTLAQMNAGAADQIWAKAANYWKTFPFTIMLRTFTEFDGTPSYAGCGSPLISAWQRMVGIFESSGATNIGFFWSPTEGQNRACIAQSYPGDAYVDWVGSDWYNVCLVGGTSYCSPLHPGWAQFAELFNYTALGSPYTSQHDAWGPRKPFIVGETGSWYDPAGDKGAWFAAIPAAAQRMTWLRGVEVYDSDVSAAEGARNNFRVDYPATDPSVYAGFKQFAADPWFNTGGP